MSAEGAVIGLGRGGEGPMSADTNALREQIEKAILAEWHTRDERLTDAVMAVIDPYVREKQAEAWRMAAVRSAPLLEAAWDEGNAMGLDGWTGPERGEEPDDHAIQRREKTVDRLADELAARADQIEKAGHS